MGGRASHFADDPDIQLNMDYARSLVIQLEREKEGFADAYRLKDFEGMEPIAKLIRQVVREFAKIFFYKEKGQKSSIGPKDWRTDSQLFQLSLSMINLVKTIDKDHTQVNLADFVRHVDQAQNKMLQILARANKVLEFGVNEQKKKRSPGVRQGPKQKENFDEWREWARKKKEGAKGTPEVPPPVPLEDLKAELSDVVAYLEEEGANLP